MQIKNKFKILLIMMLALNFLVGCSKVAEFGQALSIRMKEKKIEDDFHDGDRNNRNHIGENIGEEGERVGEKGRSASIAKIIFLGDTMMDSKVALAMDQNGDDYPLLEFMPILQKGDLIIANLETSIGTSRDLMDKAFAFQTHPSRFALFEPIKDKVVFSLANNHGMDGPLDETLENIKELGYAYVGIGENISEAFKPHITHISGISIAVIGASRVIPIPEWSATENRPGMATAYSPDYLVKVVQQYRNQVDFIIVYTHWGEERAEEPNEAQLNLEKALIDAGADLVIGSHPHVLQEIRWNTDRQLTAYSLGNFVFTTAHNPLSNDTAALEVHVSKEKIEYVKLWPGQVCYGKVRRLDYSEEGERIFKRLGSLSPNIIIKEDGEIIKKNEKN